MGKKRDTKLGKATFEITFRTDNDGDVIVDASEMLSLTMYTEELQYVVDHGVYSGIGDDEILRPLREALEMRPNRRRD